MLAEIEKIKADWPEGSDLAGTKALFAIYLALLIEIRCLLKGMAETQRLGKWGEMTITGPFPEFPDKV